MIVDSSAVVDELFEFLYRERDALNAGDDLSREEMVHRKSEVHIILAELKRLVDIHTKDRS